MRRSSGRGQKYNKSKMLELHLRLLRLILVGKQHVNNGAAKAGVLDFHVISTSLAGERCLWTMLAHCNFVRRGSCVTGNVGPNGVAQLFER